MTTEARIAKMKGAVGAVNSGAALIHAKWLAMGSPAPTATGTKLAYEGGELDVYDDMIHGYPKASSIDKVAGLGSSDYSASSGTISDAAKTTCSFTYTAPTKAGEAPAIDQAKLIDTNC
jgi:MSHA pilin protein MshA